ncbi:PREDICTED: uncharacterized protein LOC106344487 [Brassica oleracea var. oleracea]|uniref:uncharacterized protein LOC106344487 n=1 Tax=Brassica oleracea var. oleracea TaxID=109376 RepID=UPI0006A6D257|nr:PREDICTED: uncharacterized protein LOC106344487 [Brassica oleracea var. oleracea]
MDSLPFHLLEEILFKLNDKSLAIMQCVDKSINSHISNDPYFKSNLKGSFPAAMEVDENVEVMKVDLIDDKGKSGLGMIKRVINTISAYAQKKKTGVGKRLLNEDDTTLKMELQSSYSSYKLINVERINKRRRVKSYAWN